MGFMGSLTVRLSLMPLLNFFWNLEAEPLLYIFRIEILSTPAPLGVGVGIHGSVSTPAGEGDVPAPEGVA